MLALTNSRNRPIHSLFRIHAAARQGKGKIILLFAAGDAFGCIDGYHV